MLTGKAWDYYRLTHLNELARDCGFKSFDAAIEAGLDAHDLRGAIDRNSWEFDEE